MRKGLVGMIVSAILLGCSASAAPTNDELVTMAMQDFWKYEDACRGGSGDQTETWVACGSRNYAAYLLNVLGQCYGTMDQAAYQYRWHICSANSNRNRIP